MVAGSGQIISLHSSFEYKDRFTLDMSGDAAAAFVVDTVHAHQRQRWPFSSGLY